ncbi:2',5'-phosphodiesterase 12 [Trichinella pseudospiralis]|uniref:2',5'-phosphodiesterase 12 n=1 Tax=Trichinella pseudospiralis TaxID=6337 RepID=A0A0V1JK93_TRIPS|nr:2',5'-phosphodiesterase 12 [Trichinella pseudospiralis]
MSFCRYSVTSKLFWLFSFSTFSSYSRINRKIQMHLLKQFVVYVLSSNCEDKLQIIFKYPLKNREEKLTLIRERDDPLSQTLNRLSKKLRECTEKINMRKANKAVDYDDDANDKMNTQWFTNVKLYNDNGEVVDADNVTTEEAFWKSSGFTLAIAEKNYRIVNQVPYVKCINWDYRVFVDYPVHPKIVILNGEIQKSDFLWYIEEKETLSTNDSDEFANLLPGNWILRFKGYVFVPQIEDVGKKVCVICLPRNKELSGVPEVYFLKYAVEAAPKDVIWKDCQLLCKTSVMENDTFRLLSYNILAGSYLALKLPKDQLYFPYCPVEYQRDDYRIPLLMKQIPGYKADIMCLQEVENKLFSILWRPYFDKAGYSGLFKLKGGEVSEGLATFFNKEKFMYVAQKIHYISGASLMTKSDKQEFKWIPNCLNKNQEALKYFMSRPQALQVTALRSILLPDKLICIANTHLHSKGEHDYIRLLQTAICILHLNNVFQSLKEKFPESRIALCLCGDMNSTPDAALHELIEKGTVSSERKDWRTKADDEESTIATEVNMPLTLTCISDVRTFTNVTVNFSACLDYIYVNEELRLGKIYPGYSDMAIRQHEAIPSAACPSDHIPVLLEIKFQSSE